MDSEGEYKDDEPAGDEKTDGIDGLDDYMDRMDIDEDPVGGETQDQDFATFGHSLVMR